MLPLRSLVRDPRVTGRWRSRFLRRLPRFRLNFRPAEPIALMTLSCSSSILRIALAAGVWVIALLAGFAGLERYASAAGEGRAPASGVAKAFTSYRRANRALAVMAIHPRCPCTQASVAELADFIARAGTACDALIVHVVPEGADVDWPLANTRILGGREVPVIADPEGKLAAMLGAETSGHVVLIDAAGQVRFHGGITRARGHRGRATGQDAMLAALSRQRSAAEFCSAPVYGCALRGPCNDIPAVAP